MKYVWFVTTMRVFPRRRRCIASRKMKLPTWKSTALSGSSNRTMSCALYSARAIEIRCRCPPDRFAPRSATSYVSPPRRICRSRVRHAAVVALWNRRSWNGSRKQTFSRIVVFISHAVWLAYVIRPWIAHVPSARSSSLSSDRRNDVFPLPTLPRTQTSSPFLILSASHANAVSPSGKTYRAFSMSTARSESAASGTTGASSGWRRKSLIRRTETLSDDATAMKKPNDSSGHRRLSKRATAVKMACGSIAASVRIITRNVVSVMTGPMFDMTSTTTLFATRYATVQTTSARRSARRRAPIAGSQALYLTNLTLRTSSVKKLIRRSVAAVARAKKPPTKDPATALTRTKTTETPTATRQ